MERESLFTFAADAMATRFEFALHGKPDAYLRSCAEQAFSEIANLDRKLSYYRSSSEVAEANRLASTRPVRLTPDVFECLDQAVRLAELTMGHFDITVAPLMDFWAKHPTSLPTAAELSRLTRAVGYHHVKLHPQTFSVTFTHPGTRINLGSIGKGFALHKAWEILMELDVPNGLIQGGTSSIVAWGVSPLGIPWKVAVQSPSGTRPWSPFQTPADIPEVQESGSDVPDGVLAVMELDNQALSVSSVFGRGYSLGDQYLGHVIDPKSGWPVSGTQLVAMTHPHAGIADGLTTAYMVAGRDDYPNLSQIFPDSCGIIFHGPGMPLTHIPLVENPG
jgi:FAD:protein FMN transferase